jgi:hypothetical protein
VELKELEEDKGIQMGFSEQAEKSTLNWLENDSLISCLALPFSPPSY